MEISKRQWIVVLVAFLAALAVLAWRLTHGPKRTPIGTQTEIETMKQNQRRVSVCGSDSTDPSCKAK